MPAIDKIINEFLDIPEFEVVDVTFNKEKKEAEIYIMHSENRYQCSGCGIYCYHTKDSQLRRYRDLDWCSWRIFLTVNKYRVDCPRCGVRNELLPFADTRARHTKRFEVEIFLSCCDHSLTHVSGEYGLSWDTVKQIDKKYLCRWQKQSPIPQVRWLGVDEVYLGSRNKLYTVISDLQTGQVVGLSSGHQQVSLDGFFSRMGKDFCSKIEVVCMDMWKGYKSSVDQYCPHAKIIYDKFHIIKHLNDAVDEVRRQEFFRQDGSKRELIKGKRWLFLRRWFNLTRDQKGLLNELFSVNRRISVAYQLKEIFGNLWYYKSRTWAKQFLERWEKALRWQRLEPFRKFLKMVKSHLDGILNYCDIKIPLGLVECINGKIKRIVRRIRGFKDFTYFALKVMFVTSPNKELNLSVNHT